MFYHSLTLYILIFPCLLSHSQPWSHSHPWAVVLLPILDQFSFPLTWTKDQLCITLGWMAVLGIHFMLSHYIYFSFSNTKLKFTWLVQFLHLVKLRAG